MKEILPAIFSGGIIVALIEGFREYFSWKRQRKASMEDRNLDENRIQAEKDIKRIDAMEIKVDALIKSQRFIFYDRIRFFGQQLIEEKEIDLDDRRIINDMYSLYNEALGGSRDLSILMTEVNRLPLKKKERRNEGVLL